LLRVAFLVGLVWLLGVLPFWFFFLQVFSIPVTKSTRSSSTTPPSSFTSLLPPNASIASSAPSFTHLFSLFLIVFFP
jgi:hypothetical protein